MLSVIASLATALALGGMAFFSFVVARLVFRQLEREAAAAFMRAAFPRYYDWMGGTAVVAALSAAAVARVESLLMGVVAVAFLLLRFVLLPALNGHRERRAAGDPGAEAAFKRLHGLSMAVNFAQMAAAAFVMARLAS